MTGGSKHDYFSSPTGPRPPGPPVPSSPTGRVPQWARDEAAGRAVTPAPWRGATVSLLPSDPAERCRAGGRSVRLLTARGITTVLVVTGLLVGAHYLNLPGTRAPQLVQTRGAAVPRQAPPAGREEASSPLGAPPPAAAALAGTGYRFQHQQPGSGAPVTWSPCRPVHYVVRPDNAPAGGAQMLHAAIATVSRATGLRFIDDGPTSEGPTPDREAYQPGRYGNRWAPVLITWATPQEVPDFGIDVAGEAGPAGVGTPNGHRAYVTGVVYLDGRKLAAAGIAQAGEIIALHELGHLVGLEHVLDPTQVMYPSAQDHLAGYGAGDLAGLAALGRGSCQPSI